MVRLDIGYNDKINETAMHKSGKRRRRRRKEGH
jgi:hypothetical protein